MAEFHQPMTIGNTAGVTVTTENEHFHFHCVYCKSYYPLQRPIGEVAHDQHPKGCPNPLPRACYSCFAPENPASFSNNQLANMDSGNIARCHDCIERFRTTRRYRSPPHDTKTINEELMEAVSEAEVSRVQEFIDQGADPNYVRQRYVSDPTNQFIRKKAFRADGTPMPEEDPEFLQPTTPLKLVCFRISDCMLKEKDLVRFKAVADLLIAHGADPLPALAIMENRYGKWDDESNDAHEDEDQDAYRIAFCAVCRAVFRAAQAETSKATKHPVGLAEACT